MNQVPRTLQKIMSAEATPLLSGVLPAMERFVTRWETMQETYPAMSDIIDTGLQKIIEYYNKSYKQKAYPIAMGTDHFVQAPKAPTDISVAVVLNPSQKLRWISKNWGEKEQEWAISVVKKEVSLSHARSELD